MNRTRALKTAGAFAAALVIVTQGGCQKERGTGTISLRVNDEDHTGLAYASVRLEGMDEGQTWEFLDSTTTDPQGLAVLTPRRQCSAYQVTVEKYGMSFRKQQALPGVPLEVNGTIDLPSPAIAGKPEDGEGSTMASPARAAQDNGVPATPAKPTTTVDRTRQVDQNQKAKTQQAERAVGRVTKAAAPPELGSLPPLEQIRWFSSAKDWQGILGVRVDHLSGERRAEASFYRAMAYANTGKTDLALKEYGDVVRLSQRLKHQALLNIGVLQMQRSAIDEAARAYDEALTGPLSDEKRGLAYLGLAKCYLAGLPLTKQRVNYLARIRQCLWMSKDLLCAGRVPGRQAECREIEQLLGRPEIADTGGRP